MRLDEDSIYLLKYLSLVSEYVASSDELMYKYYTLIVWGLASVSTQYGCHVLSITPKGEGVRRFISHLEKTIVTHRI